jgi:hypothetical protein
MEIRDASPANAAVWSSFRMLGVVSRYRPTIFEGKSG